MQTPKIKIKRGDTVQVLRGKDRGKRGPVLAVLPREMRVVVEGLNIVKKHVRPRQQGQKGQRVQVAAPIHVSRVQVVCPKCGKGARLGITREGGVAQRVCKKCSTVLE